MLFVGFCACGEIVSITTEDTKNATKTEDTDQTTASLNVVEVKPSEIAQYADVVETILKNYDEDPSQMERTHYDLYDIDGNGTNEFLQGMDIWGVSYLTNIYTIKDGVAVWQEAFGTTGEGGSTLPSTLFKNGTIRVDCVDDGMRFFYYYYRFVDGELKFQTLLIYEQGDEYLQATYSRINVIDRPSPSTPITKAEFDRLQKEFEGDGQVVELDWKPLAEYGR